VADGPRALASALVARSLADGVSVGRDQIVADTSDVDAFGRAIAPLARELGVRLREVQPLDDDLESVFRYLVERR
jgi:ABC-2 type transport system ATP-binding protein